MRRFRDRADAGRKLAAELQRLGFLATDGREAAGAGRPGPTVVLGLARGGVVVAGEVARLGGVPLEAVVVRKVSARGYEEYALGALATFGGSTAVYRNPRQADDEQFQSAVAAQLPELRRREGLFRAGRLAADVAGKTAILVDDGLATGSTMMAAVQAVRSGRPASVVAAVPVALGPTRRHLEPVVDAAVVLYEPPGMTAVGAAFDDFAQTSEEEVLRLLASAGRA